MIRKKSLKAQNRMPDFRQYRIDWLWKQLTQDDSYQPKFPWELKKGVV